MQLVFSLPNIPQDRQQRQLMSRKDNQKLEEVFMVVVVVVKEEEDEDSGNIWGGRERERAEVWKDRKSF